MADSSEAKRRLCIDIGGDTVKIGSFLFPGPGEVVLEGYSFMETNLGDISTDDPVYQYRVVEIIRKLIAEHKYRTRDINISISGQNAFVRFVKIPAMTDDKEKLQQLLNFEAMQNLPFPADDVVYSSQIIESTDPDAMEAEAMFVIVKSSDSEKVISSLEKMGRKVKGIEIASTACYNAGHFNLVGSQQCEMILNIGGRSSTLIFMDGGKFFVRTFLTAGHTVTQQIAKEFGISFADAEELKKKHGFVGLGGAYEEPDSEVAATVSKIIRNIMTRLHGEVMRTINLYRAQHGRRPEKLYLTGGSSVMAYTPHFFSEKLKIPVEYLNPFQVVKIGPKVDKEELAQSAHMFSEVVGLAMRDAVRCPMNIDLVPEARKKQEVLKHKSPYFYASCLVLLFCLSVTYWSIAREYDDNQNTRQKAEEKVKKLEEIARRVDDNNGKLNGVRSEFKTVSELYSDRGAWVGILNLIQAATPESVWYTSIKGATGVQEVKSASPSPKTPEDDGFGGFGMGGEAPTGKPVSTVDINYIVLKGHIIVQSSKDSGIDHTAVFELLKKNLITDDGPFEKFTEKDLQRFVSNFRTNLDVNVSSFQIELKLKKPIKR